MSSALQFISVKHIYALISGRAHNYFRITSKKTVTVIYAGVIFHVPRVVDDDVVPTSIGPCTALDIRRWVGRGLHHRTSLH